MMYGKLFIYIILCGLMSFSHTNFGSEGPAEKLDIMNIDFKSAKNQKSQFDKLKKQLSPEEYQEYKMLTQGNKYHIIANKKNPEPQLTPWNRTLIIENIYDYDIIDNKGESIIQWQCMPISKNQLEAMAQSKNIFYLYAYEALAWNNGYDPYLTAKITKTIVNGVTTDLKEALPQALRHPSFMRITLCSALFIALYYLSR